MTDQHPITPPHDQVYLWWEEACKRPPSSFYEKLDYVAAKAARWGADQELEACCKWLDEVGPAAIPLWGKDLRIDRRSKPKSLAEPALEALDDEQAEVAISSYKVIRRALERLQELEVQDQLTNESD